MSARWAGPAQPAPSRGASGPAEGEQLDRPQSPLLELRALSKRYGALTALDAVDLVADGGRIHALTGANGAGKSTLMNLLAGVHAPSAGEIRLRGQAMHFASPAQARAAGISAVYQDLSVLPELTVAENIWLGQEPRTRFGWLDRRGLRERTEQLLATWALPLDPDAPAAGLSVAARQLVEIARALSTDARILTLDEPTAVLSGDERVRLFDIMRQLRDRGLLIVFVSHRLDEVFEIADDITVLRNGARVHSGPARTLDRAALVRHMVGHDVAERLAPWGAGPAAVAATIRVSLGHHQASTALQLRAGEVVGLGGLVGAGRTRFARRLAGLDGGAGRAGAAWCIDGREFVVRSAADAIRHGIVYLTEDRQRDGLFAPLSVLRNAGAANLGRWSRFGLMQPLRERAEVAPMLQRLRVVAASLRAPVRRLSGGNQQKVLFTRALLARPRLLICDEPTRGVDVGAREEIYRLIESLAAEGVTVVLISSELKELLALAHRVWVIRDAVVVAELPAGASEAEVIEAAVAR